MVIRTMSEPEKAWLAATIDGEGSIGLYFSNKNKPSEGRKVVIQVANTCKVFVERIREIIGAGTIRERLYVSKLAKHQGPKPIFHYTLSGSKRGMEVLQQILPYLLIKQEKAEGIINELKEHPPGQWTEGRRAQLSMRMKETWARRRA